MFRRHTTSFKNAWWGIKWAANTQPHFRFHLLCAVAVIAATVYLKANQTEFLIILVMITGVLVSELLNTGLEAATDAHKLIKSTPEEDRLIGIAKDVAAGAVLVMSLGAALVGLIIFIPRIF